MTSSLESLGDFESGGVDSWFESDDNTGPASITIEAGGPAGSKMAAHIVGGPLIGWGVTINHPVRCLVAKGYSGVELWMKGSGPTSIGVAVPLSTGKEDGGDCTVHCVAPGVNIPIDSEWKHYAVPFESLRNGYGLSVGDTLMSIDLHAHGRFDFWFDQVRFYRGSPAPDAIVLH